MSLLMHNFRHSLLPFHAGTETETDRVRAIFLCCRLKVHGTHRAARAGGGRRRARQVSNAQSNHNSFHLIRYLCTLLWESWQEATRAGERERGRERGRARGKESWSRKCERERECVENWDGRERERERERRDYRNKWEVVERSDMIAADSEHK